MVEQSLPAPQSVSGTNLIAPARGSQDMKWQRVKVCLLRPRQRFALRVRVGLFQNHLMFLVLLALVPEAPPLWHQPPHAQMIRPLPPAAPLLIPRSSVRKKSASSEFRTFGPNSRDCVSARTVPSRSISGPSSTDHLIRRHMRGLQPALRRGNPLRRSGTELDWELLIQEAKHLPLPP